MILDKRDRVSTLEFNDNLRKQAASNISSNRNLIMKTCHDKVCKTYDISGHYVTKSNRINRRRAVPGFIDTVNVVGTQ